MTGRRRPTIWCPTGCSPDQSSRTSSLATEDRPLELTPALTIRPQATTAAFDARFIDGADYVIVPALHNVKDPTVARWLKSQAAKGAIIVGICSGVRTLAAAGLLEGRQATGHWYDLPDLRKNYRNVSWTRDRRYVVDRGVVTTTGITASLPVSLALVEAIAGRTAAASLAAELGVDGWDQRHDSARYGFSGSVKAKAALNMIAFWNWETHGVKVSHGVDETSLAIIADAWSRTYRSKAISIAGHWGAVATKGGLLLLPDRVEASRGRVRMLPAPKGVPGRTIPLTLAAIHARYGQKTAAFVAAQLEYPWSPGPATD